MKKLALALAVGVMYLGTQATVVFAQKPTGEQSKCPTCGAVSTHPEKDPASGPSSEEAKKRPAKGNSGGISAGSNTGKKSGP